MHSQAANRRAPSTSYNHVYNESKEIHGHLPKTLRQGNISVLYKEKDRDDPRNYRPITLLNNDYKILMRILAQRMNEAVVQFVSRDQNGFVPNGFIAENIMRLQLLQDLIEEEDQEALFIFLETRHGEGLRQMQLVIPHRRPRGSRLRLIVS